jgi:uncharacterized SAM-binding protein YcdF (DUF218 family)
MNSLLSLLGIEAWKPVLTALVLPPIPLIVLSLVGARAILWRRGVGWLLMLLSAAGLWLSCTTAFAEWLTRVTLQPPAALGEQGIAELRRDVSAHKPVAIVVLGAGSEARAPEYGLSNLSAASLERLRYGIWLSRATGAPIAFSGGAGYESEVGTAEAQIAARVAEREFLRPLNWAEDQSHDTRENALRSVALLKPAGVTRIVLVTHGWHMRRALRKFHEAARGEMQIVPAAMGLAPQVERPILRWIPSYQGFSLARQALKEDLGLLLGV